MSSHSGGMLRFSWRLAAVILWIWTYYGITSSALPTKPHIIFILADDLGWYDVSWHNPKAISPRLEALAREGIILEQSYVQPVCTPTRSALLTGRYPFTIGRQHGIIRPQSPTGLLLNTTLLPQAMRDAGYSTHMVGKWHLGFCDWEYTPTMRGFDTFFGYYLGSQDYYTHRRIPNYVASCDGVSKAEFPYGYDFRNATEPEISVKGTYSTYSYASYVEDLLKSRNPDDPMFLYLSLQSVHSPLQVPENYTEPFEYIEDKDRMKKLGMVWAMDELVGYVVDALSLTGHYDNSVIVFSTDNGGPKSSAGINWPLKGDKGKIWEGGTRGPAFIHSPLLSTTGIISDTLVHVTDWYKTLVGLAGGVAPEVTDGFDQWEAITTGSTSPRTSMVYNIDNETALEAGIRKGYFKLIVGDPGNGDWTVPPEDKNSTTNATGFQDLQDIMTFGTLGLNLNSFENLKLWITNETEIRLFNITGDPEERQNLADSQTDIVTDLLKDLERELLRYTPADFPADISDADPVNFNNVWSPGWCTAK